MTPRLIATLGMVSFLAGLALAQDKAEVTGNHAVSPPVKKALEAAKDDLPRAIAILETVLKSAPDDRDALYLIGAMAVVQADKTEIKPERIALFRRSANAFARLQAVYKNLTSYEQAFLVRSRIGEARLLALEGKADQALGVIKQLLAAGFDDLDSFYEPQDLEAVRNLPAFKSALEQAARSGILEEMARQKPFPFDFELKDTSDKTVRLAECKGKVTIIDIGGTWCPPCRKEVPHFAELYRGYKDKGLEIIGINCNEGGSPDEVKQKIKEFARQTEIPYRCVLNDETTEKKIPGFQGYPTTLFLDRSGNVRMMLVGYTPKVRLEAIVTTMLAEASEPGARVGGSK